MTMKKSIFLLSLFFFGLSVFGFAQLSVGLKAGLGTNFMTKQSFNRTGLPYAPSFSRGEFIGFHVGGFVKVPIFKKLSLQPEILLTQRGTGSGQYEMVRAFYIEMPVLLQFQLNERLSIEAGPVFSRLKSATIGGSDSFDFFESSPMLLQFGVGYQIAKNVILSGSYSYGLDYSLQMTFYDVDNSILAQDKYYVRGLQISLRYSFSRHKS
jgi:hypothetical protein